MEVRDLAGLSKPLEKLIESVSSGMGILYEPHRIRRRAEAEAHGELIKADAELQKIELLQRASRRISFKELQAQVNIDNIVAEASKYLPESVDKKPVEPDWLLRFFDDCQLISDENLQSIWGKILAGEVAKPGKYSRITLSILKNLSKDDALLLEKVASLAWQIRGPRQAEPFLFIPVEFNIPSPLAIAGVEHDECLHLSSLGLLNVGKDLFIHVVDESTASHFSSRYKVFLSSLFQVNAGNLNVFSLTRSGLELFPFLNLEYNARWERTAVERMSRMLQAEFRKIPINSTSMRESV
jgi:hypothetical protein